MLNGDVLYGPFTDLICVSSISHLAGKFFNGNFPKTHASQRSKPHRVAVRGPSFLIVFSDELCMKAHKCPPFFHQACNVSDTAKSLTGAFGVEPKTT